MQDTLLPLAYVFLTLTFIISVAASYVRFVREDLFYLPFLLFSSLVANFCRRIVSPPTSALALFLDRAFFFVWPIGVLALLCLAFDKPRTLRLFVAPVAACILGVLVFGFDILDGQILAAMGQSLSGMAGALALVLLVLRGKRTAFLSTLEISAFFCGATEGLVALVGYLVPGKWWPAVMLYCALYLALIALHLRVLWTHRQRLTSPRSRLA